MRRIQTVDIFRQRLTATIERSQANRDDLRVEVKDVGAAGNNNVVGNRQQLKRWKRTRKVKKAPIKAPLLRSALKVI